MKQKVLRIEKETKITDAGFFDTEYDMSIHEIEIPEW